MKTITNIQRKAEIEKELDELLKHGSTTSGFYFNIGGQEFLFDGSWDEFGLLMKNGLPFKTLKTTPESEVDPVLSKRLLQSVTSWDSDRVFPISSIDVTPRVIFEKYTALKIEDLQKEYRSLVQDKGLIGA